MPAPTSVSRLNPAAQLGTNITDATCLDDALRTANLDWSVIQHKADNLTLFADDDIVTTSIPGKDLLIRSDNNQTLGVVGSRYTPVSNADAFSMADAAHRLGARFAYAGELDHGRKTFLTMTLPEASISVGGHDLVEFSIKFTTGHAGCAPITGEAIGTRLVCTNGMRSSFGTNHKWNIRHTATADHRLEQAETALQHAFAYAKEFSAAAEHMISTPMSRREFTEFIDTLFPEPEEGCTSRKRNLWETRRRNLLSLFGTYETQEEGRETRWAGYNSVIEWLDWFRPAQGGEEGRALRNFETGNDNGLGSRVFELLAS